MPTNAASNLYPRHATPRLLEALEDSPVVLIHGARQCGKTTLARAVGERSGYAYTSFDDSVAREAASADPQGFVAELPERVVLDEVQRVPSLFSALKRTVDERRTPGRFLLTGSSHVLTVPKLADSLAGRMEVVQLHPLSQAELAQAPPRFLDALFAGQFSTRSGMRLGIELAERIVAGGYPPALARLAGRRRTNWHRDYIDALVQRDVQELARVGSLDALPRLLMVAAAQTARLFNLTDLGSPFGLSRPTIKDYIVLLERVFLIERLRPWHSNQLSRLVKTPKLHFVDTGLACAQLDVGAEDLHGNRTLLGLLMETFVYQELRRQAACHERRHAFHHFRDKDGVEVDVVIERGPQVLAGVEVKAGATVRDSDFRGLRKLQRAVGERFAGGAAGLEAGAGPSLAAGVQGLRAGRGVSRRVPPDEPRVLHRLPTAALEIEGIAPVERPCKTLLGLSWGTARAAAAGRSRAGERGHLYFAQKGTFLLCVDRHAGGS